MTPHFFSLADKDNPSQYGSWIDLDHVLLFTGVSEFSGVIERYGKTSEPHLSVQLSFWVTFAFRNKPVDFTVYAPGCIRDPVTGLWIEANPFKHYEGVNFDTAWRLNAFEANYLRFKDAWAHKDDINGTISPDTLQRMLGDAGLRPLRDSGEAVVKQPGSAG